MSWVRVQPGYYKFSDELVEAQVMQVGELWICRVWYDGDLVDMAEWDGRRTAISNTRTAITRATGFRSQDVILRDREECDDDDDC